MSLNTNRREFIATTASAGAAMVLPEMNKAGKTQLLHHVFFWLKNPGSEQDRLKLIEGVKTLGAIAQVQQIQVGVVASTEKRDVVDNSWDVSELLFFTDTVAQKAYQDHPIHQDFIKNYSHLWAKVLVYDMVTV
ncbi:MAG: hypothetical protein RL172_2622 [Bacteroidota bacterium]|jgi:hypothetical protein